MKCSPSWSGVDAERHAGYQSDRDRYDIMIKNAGTAGASRDDVESEMRKYLATKKARPEHVDEQIERFRDLLFEEASGLIVDLSCAGFGGRHPYVQWVWRWLIAARRKFSREFKAEAVKQVWDVGRRIARRFRNVSVSPGNYRITFPFAFPFLSAKSDFLHFRVRHRRAVSL